MVRDKKNFVLLHTMVPPCVLKQIRNDAFDFHTKHGGRVTDLYPVICQYAADRNPEIKKELVDSGIIPA